MQNVRPQLGFTLTELVMVVVIVGMLAAIAVPSLMGSKDAAQMGAMTGTLKTIHTVQVLHHSQRGRYARLDELNTFQGSGFGTISGSTLRRGDWTFLMLPSPTDTSLKQGYTMYALRQRGIRFSLLMMTENGQVQTVVQ